uniref:MKI67 FHA domain-interacting nucleolar phosphoprotein-like n=1 Tax=Saccoglossus kowalevskii TaxID=10224 RepID=A0ABM0MVC6_SACKO|nr:PREDICTED: MKI67 FHA domain-interacting nucleolar phosphoprotein-like [Saccoglossus kowalevskii]
MNNYLMYHKLLKCQYLPPDKVMPALFRGCNRKFSKPKAHKLALQRHNNLVKEPERLAKSLKKLKRKDRQKKKRLERMGIEWNFDGYNDKVLNVGSPEPKPSLPTPKSGEDIRFICNA